MNIKRRKLSLVLGSFAALNCLMAPSPSSYAQNINWPERPIRIIVPYPTAGVSDSILRVLAERLSRALHQPVYVENKPGAGATLGMDLVAKAAPDGYTLGFAAISPLTLNPHVMKTPYDGVKDFAAIGSAMYSPIYLLATPKFTGKSLQDVIDISKASPGSVTIATSGYGTVGHIMVEQLQKQAGVTLTHVPYKGGSQIATDAMGGNFDLMLANPYLALNVMIDEGKLRALAVGAPERLGNLAQTPTFTELGYPTVNLTSLFGFFAPAKTPQDVINKLNLEINSILTQSDIQERIKKAENLVVTSTPQEFQALINKESANNAVIVKEANIKAQ